MDCSPPGSSDYCHLGLVSKGITFLGVVIRGRVNQLPPQPLRAVSICWAFNTHTFPISFPDDQRLVCLWARVVFRCARGVCVGMEGQREGRLQAAPQRGMVFLRWDSPFLKRTVHSSPPPVAGAAPIMRGALGTYFIVRKSLCSRTGTGHMLLERGLPRKVGWMSEVCVCTSVSLWLILLLLAHTGRLPGISLPKLCPYSPSEWKWQRVSYPGWMVLEGSVDAERRRVWMPGLEPRDKGIGAGRVNTYFPKPGRREVGCISWSHHSQQLWLHSWGPGRGTGQAAGPHDCSARWGKTVVAGVQSSSCLPHNLPRDI